MPGISWVELSASRSKTLMDLVQMSMILSEHMPIMQVLTVEQMDTS